MRAQMPANISHELGTNPPAHAFSPNSMAIVAPKLKEFLWLVLGCLMYRNLSISPHEAFCWILILLVYRLYGKLAVQCLRPSAARLRGVSFAARDVLGCLCSLRGEATEGTVGVEPHFRKHLPLGIGERQPVVR